MHGYLQKKQMRFFFNRDYDFTTYPEARWKQVIEIISDLGLISKISENDNEFWKLTLEGEEWLKQIQ